jgi:methylthioribose-1-phosphate isomerase
MNVRGAPLIAIVAALGLAVDASAQKASFTSTAEAAAFVVQAAEYLKTSRPTAVNLFTAMDQMIKLVKEVRFDSKGRTSATTFTLP